MFLRIILDLWHKPGPYVLTPTTWVSGERSGRKRNKLKILKTIDFYIITKLTIIQKWESYLWNTFIVKIKNFNNSIRVQILWWNKSYPWIISKKLIYLFTVLFGNNTCPITSKNLLDYTIRCFTTPFTVLCLLRLSKRSVSSRRTKFVSLHCRKNLLNIRVSLLRYKLRVFDFVSHSLYQPSSLFDSEKFSILSVVTLVIPI